MGSHRREDNKRMRRMQEQPIPVEASQTDVASLPKTSKKKKPKFKHDCEVSASEALVEMSAAPVWHPKYSAATIDLSTIVTSSDAHIETAMMREAAEILTTLEDRISKEIRKVASPLSVRDFVCTTCNKTFSSYHGLGGHMSIHNKQKRSLLEDASGSSSGYGERCTRKYVRRKCNKWFPTGQSFSGHKRKHYEEHKMTVLTDGNGKPPMPLPHENVLSSGTAVLPPDEKSQLPVLLGSGNVQPTRIDLVAESNPNIHLPLPQAFDAVQQPQQANCRNETEPPPSGAPMISVDTTADLSTSRRVLDLNMLPPETDDSEP